MWVFESIKAKNLMSFALLEYTLKQGVTTLVYGENLDNESQKSNGSGKSALIEAISISIVGSPMRKVKNEEIINDSADDCEIIANLTNESLSERLEITRNFFRKESSTCELKLYRKGELVITDEAKQSSVDEYNKYILFKIGLTKDEVYNNFILSKFKYQDFLSSSDKDKKDIINRFSNGSMVDDAIAKVEEDKLPVDDEGRQIDLQLANITGKIEVITEQIETEIENSTSKKNNLQESIEAINLKITDKRKEIREANTKLDALDDAYAALTDLEESVKDLEESDTSVSDCYKDIWEKLSIYPEVQLTDWPNKIVQIDNKIQDLKSSDKVYSQKLKDIQKRKLEAEKLYQLEKDKYDKFSVSFHTKKESIDAKISEMQDQFSVLEATIDTLNGKKRTIQQAISNINAKLTGTITCPKCSHQFVLADDKFDVVQAKKDVALQQSAMDKIGTDITKKELEIQKLEVIEKSQKESRKILLEEQEHITKSLEAIQAQIRPLNAELSSAQTQQENIKNQIQTEQGRVQNIRSNMFDEVIGIVDGLFSANEKETTKNKELISDAEGRIEALNNNIKILKEDAAVNMVASLKESLAKYQKELSDTNIKKQANSVKIKNLETQIQRFIEFKTYLANTKIEALSSITNEFLESIGSDIRIKFSGYTILKGGKVRDKISISLLRDGLDCGSFGKFSAGEAARVNLSTILAMQKLVNANCDLDKGLSLLVLDEILEAVDEDGLSNIFKALNTFGITALVVSHGLVSEGYPYKLIVTKENGESTIKNAN